MAKLYPVKLLAAFDRFNAGEIAGFEEHIARQLIAQGVAKEYSEAEEAAELAAKQAEADALTARAADLDARERALAEREAAIAASAPTAGDPPPQGTKK